MRHVIALIVLVFVAVVPSDSYAKDNEWEKKLLKEIVKIKDGKMTIEEFGLLSFPWAPDEKLQLSLYSEAAARDLITRDNFVAITTGLKTLLFVGWAGEFEPAIEETDNNDLFYFEELDEPIGSVDIEINIYMNKGGLQLEIADRMENIAERVTMTWNDVFKY